MKVQTNYAKTQLIPYTQNKFGMFLQTAHISTFQMTVTDSEESVLSDRHWICGWCLHVEANKLHNSRQASKCLFSGNSNWDLYFWKCWPWISQTKIIIEFKTKSKTVFNRLQWSSLIRLKLNMRKTSLIIQSWNRTTCEGCVMISYLGRKSEEAVLRDSTRFMLTYIREGHLGL